MGCRRNKTTHVTNDLLQRKFLNSCTKDIEVEEVDEEQTGFYACYLLASLCPRFKNHTYIGFTVNPRRRIRQHNGEIGSGASRTKKRRPWEMVLCIYGFPSNTIALQFEWAWQHPMESVIVRKAAAAFNSFSGVANKIKLAHLMLSLPPWNCLDITLNYFSTKHKMHYAGLPNLPENIVIQVCAMDELPCYSDPNGLLSMKDEEYPLDAIPSDTSAKDGAWTLQKPSSYDVQDNSDDMIMSDKTENDHNAWEWIERDHSISIDRESTGLGKDDTFCGSSNCLMPRLQLSPGAAGSESHGYMLCDELAPHCSSTENGYLSTTRHVFFDTDYTENNAGWQKTMDAIEEEKQQRQRLLFDIEVIDLLSPSPRCGDKLCTNKNLSLVLPQVIDLT